MVNGSRLMVIGCLALRMTRLSSFLFDLRSSLLTLGRAQASLALLSLTRSLPPSTFLIPLSSFLFPLSSRIKEPISFIEKG